MIEQAGTGQIIYRVYNGSFACDHTDHGSIDEAAFCEDTEYVEADPSVVVSADGGRTWKFVNGMSSFSRIHADGNWGWASLSLSRNLRGI